MKNLKYIILTFILFFSYIIGVKADSVCVYKENDFNITCTAKKDDSSVSCVDNSIGTSYNNKNSLQYSDFKKGCPEKIHIQLYQDRASGSAVINILDITTKEGKDTHPLANDKASSKPDTEEIKSYEDDPAYQQAVDDINEYCNLVNSFIEEKRELCEEAKLRADKIKNSFLAQPAEGGLDLENPCNKSVLGVFTTVGWFFFIVKILVPVILIVFGTIDVSKAVVSSKEDEIKKSIHTLVIRAIAGVIVFFIPTVLNSIVSVIGNGAEDIYNGRKGQFVNCTKCMLKPNQPNCSTLGGN